MDTHARLARGQDIYLSIKGELLEKVDEYKYEE